MIQPADSLPNPPNTVAPSDPTATPELDRDLLNNLTRRALEPQTYFGKGLDLTTEDRQQLDAVSEQAEAKLKPHLESTDWAVFQQLVEEGHKKGVLLSFVSNPGTNVPAWCQDGGATATIRKIRTSEDAAAIEVPSDIFNTFHWKNTVASLRAYARTTDEGLRGRATKDLGISLQQLAHFVGKPESTDVSEL